MTNITIAKYSNTILTEHLIQKLLTSRRVTLETYSPEVKTTRQQRVEDH